MTFLAQDETLALCAILFALIPLAIPLLLSKANLGRIFRESGKVVLTSICAVLCTGRCAGHGAIQYSVCHGADRGAGPTAAIASANGWKELVTPGIVCGLFGYIIANFIGVTITNFLE
tara:strand:+ start:29370 stop:29723 length:354 start_codon:yes stop_codon:yes gene_type:complete